MRTTPAQASTRAAVVVGGGARPTPPLASKEAFPGQHGGAFYSTGAAHSGVHSMSSASCSHGSAIAARFVRSLSRAATAADAQVSSLGVVFGVVMD